MASEKIFQACREALAMERGPRFSVILPTHNRLDCLLEALDSIRRQSFTNYEVVVVDDGDEK